MATYYTLTVDAVGSPEAIVIQTVCQRVKLREADQSAATLKRFKTRRSSTTSTAVQYEGGETSDAMERSSWWKPGDIAGYIETNSGSVDFIQIEEP